MHLEVFNLMNTFGFFGVLTYGASLLKDLSCLSFFSINSGQTSSFIQYFNEDQLTFGLAYSPFMEGLVELHDDLLLSMLMILIFVSWFLLQLIYRYANVSNRRKKNSSSLKIHDTPLEIVWTILPAVILIFIAVPTFALLYAMDEEINPSFTLRVLGHQWYWSYEYGKLLYNDSFLDTESDLIEFYRDRFGCHLLSPSTIELDFFKYGYCSTGTPHQYVKIDSDFADYVWIFGKNTEDLPTTPDFEVFLLTHTLVNNVSSDELTLVHLPTFFWAKAFYFPNSIVENPLLHEEESSLFHSFNSTPGNLNMVLTNMNSIERELFFFEYSISQNEDPYSAFTGKGIINNGTTKISMKTFYNNEATLKNALNIPGSLHIFDSYFNTILKDSDGLSTEFESYMIGLSDLDLTDFSALRLLETDTFVCLPIKTHIRALITSYDVLHSWCLPSLGVKMDAVPGRLNEFNLYISAPGVYYGQCSELCGANHAFMPIKVEAVEYSLFEHYSILDRLSSCLHTNNGIESSLFFGGRTSIDVLQVQGGTDNCSSDQNPFCMYF